MKKLTLTIALLTLILSNPVSAAYFGGVKINTLWLDNTKLHLGFDIQPADCATNTNGLHAFIDNNASFFKEKLSVLLTAKALGLKINIWYTDNGDCSTNSTLLSIYRIAIAGGQ